MIAKVAIATIDHPSVIIFMTDYISHNSCSLSVFLIVVISTVELKKAKSLTFKVLTPSPRG